MLSIHTILHPTDFSNGAATALDHAVHLARHFDAELHLLHVAPTFGDDPIHNAFESSVDGDDFLAEVWADADRQLKAVAAGLSTARIRMRRVLTRGAAAAPVILDYARSESADLIVMGTHGRRGLKHVLIGSVTEEVMHRATCHVLTVREQEGPRDEARPIQRLLVPVDFSALAGPLLQAARDLAGDFGARLDLLHVIKPLPFSVSLTTPVAIQELVPGIREDVYERLETLYRATKGHEVPVSVHVAEGQPASVILDMAAGQPFDLIMLAPSAMTGLERFFLGSVAERVVRGAPCPVFVAKVTDAEEAPSASAAATHET